MSFMYDEDILVPKGLKQVLLCNYTQYLAARGTMIRLNRPPVALSIPLTNFKYLTNIQYSFLHFILPQASNIAPNRYSSKNCDDS